ncbi:hypothetical protein GGR57DRAFT_224163 [Xylariaceae sp. FL1272]|nr:hypothetical protein GGR57DRAFT_224163 [Xylariaceae sp. FL1272]
MSSNYVPPYRRGEAPANTTGNPPSTAQHGASTQHPFSNSYRGRGGRGSRGSRGNYRGNRGNHRGGRGGNYGNFFQKKPQEPQVDESQLVHQRDVQHHFEAQDDGSFPVGHSTLNGSKEHPGDLSYMLLFRNANPRWESHKIIFAKSNLALIPGFDDQKKKRGVWVLYEDLDGSGKDAPEAVELTTEKGAPTSTDISSDIPVPGDNIHSTQPEVTTDATLTAPVTVVAEETALGAQCDGGKPATAELGHIELETIDVDTKSDEQHKIEDTAAETKVAPDREEHHAPAPTNQDEQPTSQSQLKYTDIRLMPDYQTQSVQAPSVQKSTNADTAPIEYEPSSSNAVAVFEERRPPVSLSGPSKLGAWFIFKGWFKVSRVNILAPNSSELVRMLQQKWELQGGGGSRTANAWKASLEHEWAVIKFEVLEGEAALPAPQIEKSTGTDLAKHETGKGVNEMLAELRVKDANEGPAQSQGTNLMNKDPGVQNSEPDCLPQWVLNQHWDDECLLLDLHKERLLLDAHKPDDLKDSSSESKPPHGPQPGVRQGDPANPDEVLLDRRPELERREDNRQDGGVSATEQVGADTGDGCLDVN